MVKSITLIIISTVIGVWASNFTIGSFYQYSLKKDVFDPSTVSKRDDKYVALGLSLGGDIPIEGRGLKYIGINSDIGFDVGATTGAYPYLSIGNDWLFSPKDNWLVGPSLGFGVSGVHFGIRVNYKGVFIKTLYGFWQDKNITEFADKQQSIKVTIGYSFGKK